MNLSNKNKELLKVLEKMMKTSDNKGAEWWAEFDREFTKYSSDRLSKTMKQIIASARIVPENEFNTKENINLPQEPLDKPFWIGKIFMGKFINYNFFLHQHEIKIVREETKKCFVLPIEQLVLIAQEMGIDKREEKG